MNSSLQNIQDSINTLLEQLPDADTKAKREKIKTELKTLANGLIIIADMQETLSNKMTDELKESIKTTKKLFAI